MTEFIDIDNIETTENVRITTEDNEFYLFMENIREQGLLQPIGVFKQGDKYRVAFGNRRLAAMRGLLHTKLEVGKHVIILPRKMDEKEWVIVNLSENLQRKDISAPELGRQIEFLHEHEKMNVAAIAVALNIPKTRAETALKIWREIPKEHRDKVIFKGPGHSRKEAGYLASGAAITIAKFAPAGMKKELLDVVSKRQLNSDQARILCALTASGKSLALALDCLDEYHITNVRLVMKKSVLDELERERHGGKSWRISRIIRHAIKQGIRLPRDLLLDYPGEEGETL